MRFLTLIPLAAVASAFIIPDQQTLESLSIEEHDSRHIFPDEGPRPEGFWKGLEEKLSDSIKYVDENVAENIAETAVESVVAWKKSLESVLPGDAWPGSADCDHESIDFDHPPPHRGPPGHGPPGRGGPPGHKKPPHKRPHHPPPHHKLNLTVYELIAKSNYTTKLAKLIGDYPDLVDLLNSTTANFTIFAPIDKAFRFPKHASKPSKEFIKNLLAYHVANETYPAGRVLFSNTIPTLLDTDFGPQRISTQLGLRGLTINHYSKIIIPAVNIFGSNGVIHAIDSILFPPPKAVSVISHFPTIFSQLELGLLKTGLLDGLNATHPGGGTFFAPDNNAFKRLGPKANAFLFSPFGLKYLKALLQYHLVKDITLYSNTVYKSGSEDAGFTSEMPKFPKGRHVHTDLPTVLGPSLAVDLTRFGPFISIMVNGYTKVSVKDVIVSDGNVHVVPNILIPPKPGSSATGLAVDISVEELKERLTPFIGQEEAGYQNEL